MAILNNLKTLLLVVILLAFQCCRLFLCIIQKIKWKLDGTEIKAKEARSGYHFARSAHVLDIAVKYNFDPICLPNTPSSFILCHNDFVNPSYVLKDEVSLYYVDENEAVFVEAPPGVQVWRNKYGAWHKLAQYNHAARIIRMPISSFIKVTEELPDPGKKMLFAYFVSRSGSTLLCNMFEESGHAISFAKAHAFIHPYDKMGALRHLEADKSKQYIKAMGKHLCKPTLDENIDVYFIKIPAKMMTNYLVNLYREVFPESKVIFLYRDFVPMAISCDKLMSDMPIFNVALLVRGVLVFQCIWQKLWVKSLPLFHTLTPTLEYILGNTKHFDTCYIVYMWTYDIYIFKTASKQDFNIAAVKYEDIVSNPLASLKALFTFLGLSKNHEDAVPKALKALEYHSQASSIPMRKGGAPRIQLDNPSAGLLKDMNAICEHLGSPSLYEETRLENTITVQ